MVQLAHAVTELAAMVMDVHHGAWQPIQPDAFMAHCVSRLARCHASLTSLFRRIDQMHTAYQSSRGAFAGDPEVPAHELAARRKAPPIGATAI